MAEKIDEYILPSIKKVLGISPDIAAFDTDITMHINTVLANLVQMGIGPSTGYAVTSSENKWSDFITYEQPLLLQNVKSYVYIKVKMLFDPPSATSVIDAMNNQAKEIEYRMYTQVGNY